MAVFNEKDITVNITILECKFFHVLFLAFHTLAVNITILECKFISGSQLESLVLLLI